MLLRYFNNINICLIVSSVLANKICLKVNKGAKIRDRYNQVPHLIQDTNGKLPFRLFGHSKSITYEKANLFS